MNLRGERWGIFLGPSGVGKSTLLRILNQLDKHDEGSISFDEKPLDKKCTIGMVFQHFNLFEHLTVEENIIFPLKKSQKKTHDEAAHAAATLLIRYGLTEKRNAQIQTLSGGEKQRLAIARALALNPEVICLDEPTSALDPERTSEIVSYIQELALDNKIVLITTHDTSLISQIQGTLFLMQSGQIIEKTETLKYFSAPESFPFIKAFLK